MVNVNTVVKLSGIHDSLTRAENDIKKLNCMRYNQIENMKWCSECIIKYSI